MQEPEREQELELEREPELEWAPARARGQVHMWWKCELERIRQAAQQRWGERELALEQAAYVVVQGAVARSNSPPAQSVAQASAPVRCQPMGSGTAQLAGRPERARRPEGVCGAT